VQIEPHKKKTYMEQVQKKYGTSNWKKLLPRKIALTFLSGSYILSKEIHEYSDCKLYLFAYRRENSGSEKWFFFMQKFHVPQVTSKNKQLYIAFVNVYPKLYGRRQSEVWAYL